MKLRRLLIWVPRLAFTGAVLVAVAIAILSLLPGSNISTQNLNDKLNHFIAYSVLSALAVLSRVRWPVLAVVVAIILFGFGLEALQGLMPYGRSASWLDGLANTSGALFGAMAVLAIQQISSKRSGL